MQEVVHDSARVHKSTASMKLQRCFAVKSGLNGLLDVARRIYCEIVDDLEDIVAALAEEHGLPLRVGFNAARGYHVQAVGNKRTPMVRARDLPKTFLNPQEGKNSLTFTTEEIIQADKRGQDVLREITLMSSSIVEGLLAEVRESIGCLYKLSEIVSQVDVLLAMTGVSQRPGFVRPKFGGATVIKEGRHPILEHMGSSEVVPNDAVATPETNFIVLTGLINYNYIYDDHVLYC